MQAQLVPSKRWRPRFLLDDNIHEQACIVLRRNYLKKFADLKWIIIYKLHRQSEWYYLMLLPVSNCSTTPPWVDSSAVSVLNSAMLTRHLNCIKIFIHVQRAWNGWFTSHSTSVNTPNLSRSFKETKNQQRVQQPSKRMQGWNMNDLGQGGTRKFS